MADLTIPLVIATPIGIAVSAAIAALWGKIKEVEKRERTDCSERIEKLEERIEKLEADGEHWRDMWVREVERGVSLRSTAAQGPRRPEPPEWEENTAVRSQRALIEQRALDAELRRYAESTPPRQRMPSRRD